MNFPNAKIAAEFVSQFLSIAHESVIACKKPCLFVSHGTNHRVGEMIRSRLGDSVIDFAVTDDETTWAAVIRSAKFDKFELNKIRRIYSIAEKRAIYEASVNQSVEPTVVATEDEEANLELLVEDDETDEPFPYLTQEGYPMLDVAGSAYFKDVHPVTIEATRHEAMSLALEYVNYFFTAKLCPHFVSCGEELKYINDFAWRRFGEIYDEIKINGPIPLIEDYVQRWKELDEQFHCDVKILNQPRPARPWSVSEPYSDHSRVIGNKFSTHQ